MILSRLNIDKYLINLIIYAENILTLAFKQFHLLNSIITIRVVNFVDLSAEQRKSEKSLIKPTTKDYVNLKDLFTAIPLERIPKYTSLLSVLDMQI